MNTAIKVTILFFFGCLSAIMAQQSLLKVTSANIHGVYLRSSEDLRFQKALRPDRDRNADVLIPYSALVDNTTDRDVLGFTIRWVGMNENGKLVNHTYVNYDYQTFVALPAKSSVVVSALASFNIAGLQASPMRIRKLLAAYQRRPYVDASIDALIFSDGSAVGPDYTNSVFQVKAHINAESDLSKWILSNLDSPDKVQSELTRLRSEAIKSMPAGSDQNPMSLGAASRHTQDYSSCYLLQKGYMANTLLSQITDHGAKSVLLMAQQWWSGKHFPAVHRLETE